MDNIADALAELRGRVDALTKVCTALLAAHPEAGAILAQVAGDAPVRRDQPPNSSHHYYINGMGEVLVRLESALDAAHRARFGAPS
jgi:hypothetical protein